MLEHPREAPEPQPRVAPQLGDLIDRRVAPDLRDEAGLVEEENVERRVDAEEGRRHLARLLRIVRGDGAACPFVLRQYARRERQVGQVVVELREERFLRVDDAVVDLVEHLRVQDPREDRQRREHHDNRQRDERRELRPDGG